MSKRKIKQRVLDICAGAGYFWREEYGHFESYCSTGKCLEMVSSGIIEAFGLPEESRVGMMHWADHYDSIDTLVSLVDEAIRFEIEENQTNE